MSTLRPFIPGGAVPLREVPQLDVADFRRALIAGASEGQRISALFAVPQGAAHQLYAVLADPGAACLRIASTVVTGRYPALTPDLPAAHWFEREIAEETGLIPDGHPWLKPVRFSQPGAQPGVAEYFRIEGAEVHEVAVGPVHAGIIEPGHFRFQAFGEEVLHLEISLGYQHRGVERAMAGGPDGRSLHYAETLAGDTTVGHATAYAQVVEALTGARPAEGATFTRAIALELERIANHVGDLGALAADIGYLPTASFCGRIRGDALNLTAMVCGNRFGRGWVRPGGVRFTLDPERIRMLRERLDRVYRDAREAVSLLWETPSVRSRFERTGVLAAEVCRDLGIVGVAARASGLARDVRAEFPAGPYAGLEFAPATETTGDVAARARVRWSEVEASCVLVGALLDRLGPGDPSPPVAFDGIAPDHLAATLVEGWRGEICHVALTGADGRFARYKVVDPSFHNWFGLAYAMRGQAISDFPLCNKSFNLSYCGHDL